MPAYVAKRAQDALNRDCKAVNGSVIVLVGVTYKANVSDMRETPARPLAQQLLDLGADVRYLDPHVEEFRVGDQLVPAVGDTRSELEEADLFIVLQSHREIMESDILDGVGAILDTSGSLNGDNVDRL
jgi:UDP-N-acetyl-D-mannosaminuronate dehydrogenase